MAIKIASVGQKGGVGKSTIARLIACEYASAGWEVKLADMDVGQNTSTEWQSRRIESGTEPIFSVEQYSRIDRALRLEDRFDLIVFDGRARATKLTLQIAEVCDLIILPTGFSLDDMNPTIKLAHEMKQRGISKERIVFALCRGGDSDLELEEARTYIMDSGYNVLDGMVPERTGYRRASDKGRCLTETLFSSLNEKSSVVVQSVVSEVERLFPVTSNPS